MQILAIPIKISAVDTAAVIRACPTIQTPSSKRTECFRNMELFAVEENICWTSPVIPWLFIFENDNKIVIKVIDKNLTPEHIRMIAFREKAEASIRAGAHVDERDSAGRTALMHISEAHKIVSELGLKEAAKTAEMLIRNGADVNAKDNLRFTVIMYAAEAGNNEVVELLIRNGAEVDAKNDGGETALMLASKSGHTETAEILIRNGADVNARDNLGYPVVAFAMEFGHMETAEMLIRNGVDIHPEELQTAMFLYTLSRRRAEMLRSQKPNEEELI
jgi:hypothetical protein